jgi:hypothetical protein
MNANSDLESEELQGTPEHARSREIKLELIDSRARLEEVRHHSFYYPPCFVLNNNIRQRRETTERPGRSS